MEHLFLSLALLLHSVLDHTDTAMNLEKESIPAGSDSTVVASDDEYYANIPRKRYFFGAQGRALTAQVAIAGSIGFMLFGYDQGVLGVCHRLGANAAHVADKTC